MQIFAGTSGFSYPQWKGSFYPPDLPDGELLAYYAARLPVVEINNTFYRMPRADLLTRWAEKVPVGFQFVLKAPQRITHKDRLEGTADAVAYLWKTAAGLGQHLGPFLFQLPPTLRADPERLRRFLDDLPSGMRAAFEFRHASWDQPAVTEALVEAGCALCIADTEDAPAGGVESGAAPAGSSAAPVGPIAATADFGYLRLRRPDYTDVELDAWASRIRVEADRWQEVYVFFKHEEAGAAARLALRMAARFIAAPCFAPPTTEATSRWP